MLARLRAGVADGGTGIHRSHALHGAGAGEQSLEQGGFSALERPYQRNTARAAIGSLHRSPPTCGAFFGGALGTHAFKAGAGWQARGDGRRRTGWKTLKDRTAGVSAV